MTEQTSFIEELKRRNVVRVGVVYLIAAWLLAQVSDLMLENFEAPGWVIKVVLMFLMIGFPVSLIFAWAFELTPEGIKKEKDVDRSQSITHKTGRKLDFIIIGILVFAVGVLLFDRFSQPDDISPTEAGIQQSQVDQQNSSTEQVAGDSGNTNPSIAVLPFVNMSSDPEQEYFSDGISEEILNALAGVKELKVAGRTSSFAFKGKDQDLRQIGETLGVEHILEGSVRKSGSTVRITAQLIQVDDGFHLWSDTYDRELTNVFEIQDEISTAILEQLKKHLVGLETAAKPELAERTDPEVYDRYLLAKQRIYERKSLSIESAAALLDQAIAKDPDYAPAFALRGIAAMLLSEFNYGETKKAEAEAQGKLYFDQALRLDSGLAEGWAAKGLYHANRPGENPQAIEALEKALSINPNLIDASNWLQVAYSNLGEISKALTILEDMVDRDPLYPPGFGNAVSTYNDLGMTDKSFALIERVRPFLPGDPQVLQSEATTWMALGKPSKAIPLLDTALATQRNDRAMRQILGWGLLYSGQFERAAAEANPWHQAAALSILGRKEEALIIAQNQAAEGRAGVLITQLYRNGDYQQLVDFLKEHWPDLADYEREYPDSGGGYGEMIAIAYAYSQLGNQAGFDDAMARVQKAHQHSIEQGVDVNYFLMDHVRYLALANDTQAAISTLSHAVDKGLLLAVRPDQLFPEVRVLAGQPEYEAALRRMTDNVNAERIALGLEPVST